jgi:hypothetical protein
MKPVQVTGHVDKDGKLELGQLPALTPGEDLNVPIMETASLNALEKMLEIVADTDIADPELLAQLEALDEAIWGMQFASSQDALAKLAEQALADHKQGKTVELDRDELNRKET